jgi:subtilisin family serine protease
LFEEISRTMRRSLVLTLFSTLVLGACSDEATAPSARIPSDGIAFSVGGPSDGTGTYLVRFKGNGIPADFASTVARLGGEVIFAHPIGIAAVAGLDDGRADQLSAVKTVAAVDADAFSPLNEPAMSELMPTDDGVSSPSNPTLAFFYPRQWNMRAIHADEAWAAGTVGSPSVRVGVIDTGIDYLYPDLFGRVDLNASRSFLSAAENARVPAGANLVADLHYHGTFVSNTIVSNGFVLAGVTSRPTLVGLKVCAPGTAPLFQAGCPTSSVLGALLYAADIGLDVVNLSLGGEFQRREASAKGGNGPSFIATINRVFNYVNNKGTTVVVASGNDATDLGTGRRLSDEGWTKVPGLYGAYCDAPSVICVSATGPTGQGSVNGPFTNVDAFATYSNFGRGAIDVAAPGGNVSPIWGGCSGFTIITSFAPCRTRFFNPTTGQLSAFIIGAAGTSAAAPHVTAIAALLAEVVGHNPAQIDARLRQSSDDLGQPGNDPFYGHGRVNAAKAVGLQ